MIPKYSHQLYEFTKFTRQFLYTERWRLIICKDNFCAILCDEALKTFRHCLSIVIAFNKVTSISDVLFNENIL